MTPFPTLTLSERARLMEAWRAGGFSAEAQTESAARALADCALRLTTRDTGAPVVVLTGQQEKGAVGMAAVRLLLNEGVAVRWVLAGTPETLSAEARHQYDRLSAQGIQPWGLSVSSEAMDAQAPIDWLAAVLFVDALLDADLQEEPRGDAADLIRTINSTRRPILSYDVPSGVSGDEGYILSPCVTAAHTLAPGLPLRGALEAAPVAGTIWIAEAEIPEEAWQSLQVSPYPFAADKIVNLGPARRLR